MAGHCGPPSKIRELEALLEGGGGHRSRARRPLLQVLCPAAENQPAGQEPDAGEEDRDGGQAGERKLLLALLGLLADGLEARCAATVDRGLRTGRAGAYRRLAAALRTLGKDADGRLLAEGPTLDITLRLGGRSHGIVVRVVAGLAFVPYPPCFMVLPVSTTLGAMASVAPVPLRTMPKAINMVIRRREVKRLPFRTRGLREDRLPACRLTRRCSSSSSSALGCRRSSRMRRPMSSSSGGRGSCGEVLIDPLYERARGGVTGCYENVLRGWAR